jgi:hypothetical protein
VRVANEVVRSRGTHTLHTDTEAIRATSGLLRLALDFCKSGLLYYEAA